MDQLKAQSNAVQAAVLAMYGLTPGPHNAQQEAIQWLLSFENSSAAWTVLPLLLESEVEPVRFWAANGLYNQVRSRWHELLPSQRIQAIDSFWVALAHGPPDIAAKKRICLAIAAAAVQTENGLLLLVQRASELHMAALAAGDEQVLPRLYLVAELLLCADDMADQLQATTAAIRTSVSDGLARCACTVLDMLQHMLTAEASPLCVRAVHAALSRGPISPLCLSGLCTVLSAAARWVTDKNMGGDGGGLGECARFMPSLDAALACLAIRDPPESLTIAVAEYVEALLVRAGGEGQGGTGGRDGLCAMVGAHLLGVGPGILAAARSSGTYVSARAIASCIKPLLNDVSEDWGTVRGATLPPQAGVTLAGFPFVSQAAVADCVGGGGGPPCIGGEPVGVGVLLGDLLLQCACLPDLAMQDVAQDVFFCIGFTSMADRHPYYRRPITSQLLLVYACLAIGCGGAWEAGGAAGEEARLTLRAKVWRDAIQDAFNVLKLDTVHTVLALLEGEGVSPTLSSVLPPSLLSPPYSRLEAVLYVLRACCSPSRQDDLPAALMESSVVEGGGEGDPSASEALVALLLSVLRQDPRTLPPELACTTCKLVSALRDWLGSLPVAGTIRCTPAPGVRSDPSLSASFTSIPVMDLLSSAVSFLLSSMQCTSVSVGQRGAGGRVPPPTTCAGAEAYLSGKAEVGGEDGEEEEEDRDGEGGGVLCAAAAIAFGRTLSACAGLTSTGGGVVLARAVLAVEAATAAGLPLHPRGSVLEALLHSTVDLLPHGQWDAMARAALGPTLQRVQSASARIASGVDGSGGEEDVRSCVVEVALLSHVLTLAQADAVVQGGAGADGWLGPTPEHEGERGGAVHVLQFIGDAVWAGLDGVLARVHSSSAAVAVLLYFYKQCVRCFPALTKGRLPGVISAAAQLYSAHLHASALSAVDYALITLLSPSDTSSAIPGAWSGPVAGLLTDVTRVTAEAAAGGPQSKVLTDDPAVLHNYFSLLQSCTRHCSTALAALPPPVLATTLRLIRAAFESGARTAAKAGVEYAKYLLLPGPIYEAHRLPAALQSCAAAALVQAAPDLGASLAHVLSMDGGGDNLTQLAVELLACLAKGAGAGAVLSSTLSALGGIYSSRAAVLLAAEHVGSPAHATLSEACSRGARVEGAGFLSLSMEEHSGILSRAFQCLGDPSAHSLGPGPGGSPVQSGPRAATLSRSALMLLTSYSRVCRGEGTRDTLLAFALAGE